MKDLRQTDDMDLYLDADGDIAWAESVQVQLAEPKVILTAGRPVTQHQWDILFAHKGEYRLTPTVGVGASEYLDDEGPDALRREIVKQYTQDGMNVISVNAKLEVIAGY